MFGVGFQEMVIIGLLFLVVFGPNKLTGTTRELGQFMREARRSVEEFKAELMSEEDPYDEHESERAEQHQEDGGDLPTDRSKADKYRGRASTRSWKDC